MNTDRLRDFLSAFLLCAQLAIPLVVFIIYLSGGLLKEEMIEVHEIVVPMVAAFGGYGLTHIVKSRARRRKARKREALTRMFVVAAVGLPLIFLVSVTGAILLKAYNIALESFDDLKLLLAVMNTVFGAGCGTLMAALFGKEES